MSKTTAPLLSFDAAGQIAKTMVFSRWKGISYARRYVVPANPKSAEQLLTRTAFSWLQNAWKYAPTTLQAAFDAYASSQQMTGRNAFTKFNLASLRTAANLDLLVFSPGARSGLIAADMVLTPGDDQITVALTAPTLPTGWTISKGVAVAIEQQDPNTGVAFDQTAGEDASDPYSIVLTGLLDATTYVVGGWFEFVRPDGLTAYGQSLNDTALTT